jgi:hypothetical protein
VIDGQECDICTETLDEACRRYGKDFCELRTTYKTTGMTTDEVTTELIRRLEPEQLQTIRQVLIDRGVATAR